MIHLSNTDALVEYRYTVDLGDTTRIESTRRVGEQWVSTIADSTTRIIKTAIFIATHL